MLKGMRKALRQQLQAQTVGYITAGLGLVAGLAWNEAIKELINFLFPRPENSLLAKFAYAFLLTAVIGIISVLLVRFKMKDK